MNLVIQDDEGQIIYGHEVLKRISQTGMTPEVNIARGAGYHFDLPST